MDYIASEISMENMCLNKICDTLENIKIANTPQPKRTVGILEMKQLSNELDMDFINKIPKDIFKFDGIQTVETGLERDMRRYELKFPISKPISYYLLLAYSIFKKDLKIEGYCPTEIAIVLSKGGVMENEINLQVSKRNLDSSSILKFADIIDFLDLKLSLFVLWTETKSSIKQPKRRAISGKTRQDVLMRDNYTCQICGATVEDGVKLEIDHIIPYSKGGTNKKNNLQVLCQQCNREKHNRDDLLHDKRKLVELEGK